MSSSPVNAQGEWGICFIDFIPLEISHKVFGILLTKPLSHLEVQRKWVEGNQVKTVMILSAHFHAGTLYWVLSPMLGWAFLDFASSAAGSASFLLLKYHRYWCIYIYTDTFNIFHLCSMVYKSVCQQHSEQMYRSLLELVSSFLRDVAAELQVQ